MSARHAALIALALAACGDDLSHPAVPHLSPHPDGEILPVVNIETITFPGDPLADQDAAFDDFVVGSQWLRTVGGEYGIRGGVHVGHAVMTTPAPADLTDAEIEQMVDHLIQDGTVPGPTEGGVPILYTIYVDGTRVHWQNDDRFLCGDVGGSNTIAYHGWAVAEHVAYAVIPNCSGLAWHVPVSAHEVIEAATDPFGTGLYVDPAPDDPWEFDQEEAADLCQYYPPVAEGSWLLERSWSNAGAEAIDPEPCVPADPASPYRNVYDDRDRVLELPPAGVAHLTLTGWSSAPMADWPIFADQPFAKLDQQMIGDGKQVALTLGVPASATPGTTLVTKIYSAQYGSWPVVVKVCDGCAGDGP